MDFADIAERCAELARTRQTEAPAVEVFERITPEDQEIGFSARLLVQATLPHSRPAPGVTEFQRSNGLVTVHIQAPAEYGLPYGTYPRLLLAWVTTEAVRTKALKLELGDSLRQFMRKLGISEDGRSMRRLREHMTRLFTSTVSMAGARAGELRNVGFRPVEDMHLFWDLKAPDQRSLWQSTIELNKKFFDEITAHPVPVDMAALRTLARERSPLALDLYQWLTHRMSYLQRSTTIPWESLALQFGGGYGRTRDFKAKLMGHLGRVLEVYPQAHVEAAAGGLLLRPSQTHVPMRALKGGRR